MTTPLALLEELISEARLGHTGHPNVHPVVYVDELEAALRRHPTAVVVCRYCHSANLTGARHGLVAPDPVGEPGDVVCVWPCNHEVRAGEWFCHTCHPDDVPPF